MQPILEERLNKFKREYVNPYDEAIRQLVNTSTWALEKVFGEGLAEELCALQEKHSSELDESSWRKGNPSSEVIAQTALARDLARLHAFSYYGLVLDENGKCGHLVDVFGIFTPYDDLDECCPSEWSGRELLDRALCAARARARLDGFSMADADPPVSQEGLAILGGVSLKTIKNLLTPSSGSGLRANADGTIPRKDASAWLKSRNEFLPSVWQYAIGGEPVEQYEDHDLEDVIFVPEARDGSFFSPHLVRNGAFTIGPKGRERQVADFREALSILERMPHPSWRRPNENGNWGIVVGTQWLRKTAIELGIRS